MASNFYRGQDSPRYILGHALELAFLGVSLIAASVILTSYARINKSRARRLAAGEGNDYTAEQLSALGDRAITFRYMY